MRKKDRIRYAKKYGGKNKVIFYRNPKEFNLSNIKREVDSDGNLILLAYLKKKKMQRLIKFMKVLEQNREMRELRKALFGDEL